MTYWEDRWRFCLLCGTPYLARYVAPFKEDGDLMYCSVCWDSRYDDCHRFQNWLDGAIHQLSPEIIL